MAIRAKKQAQAIADEAVSLSERVTAVQGMVETLRSESGRALEMLAAHREEVPRLLDPLAERLNAQRDEMLAKVVAAESAARSDQDTLRLALTELERRHGELIAATSSLVANAVEPVRATVAQALAQAGRAIDQTERALSRELPSVPDCIVDQVIEGDHLVGIYASGARKDFGQVRFKGKPLSGGGRASSAQLASMTAGAATTTPVTEVTDNYTMKTSDYHVTMNSAGNKTVTLFAATSWGNRRRCVTNIGAGTLTVTGAQTISGLSSVALAQWASIDLIVANNAWVIA